MLVTSNKTLLKLLILTTIFWGAVGCSNQSSEDIPQDINLPNDQNMSNSSLGGYPVSENITDNGYPNEEILNEGQSNIVENTIDLVIPTPEPGVAVVTGHVVSNDTEEPIVNVPVVFAQVYRNEENEGAFVFDTASSPTAWSDGDGRFVITNIQDGEYVMVVGNIEVNNYVIYSESSGEAVLWDVSLDQILDVGEIKVDLDW